MYKNIFFFGTGGIFSNIVLNKLIEVANIKFVFILVKKNSVLIPMNQVLCEEKRIKYKLIYDVNTNNVKKILKKYECDLSIVASFSQIISPEILNSVNCKFINIHPSFLPFYRGANPLFWQIKDGVNQCGVTIHYINEKIDMGEIIKQDYVCIENLYSGEEILEEVAIKAGEMMGILINEENLISMESFKENNNTYNAIMSEGFYNPKPSLKDYEVNIHSINPDSLYKLVNRLAKWGRLYFFSNGKQYFINQVIFSNGNDIKILDDMSEKIVCVTSKYGEYCVIVERGNDGI